MRAIISGKKVMTYGNFVIKYFMFPQNIGENKVGVIILLFFSASLYTAAENADLKHFKF